MIDSRILEMVFKNKQFEDGVSDSIRSLEKLDRSLENVDGDGTSKAMDKLGNVCEQVGHKFSALETLATGVLLNIGSKIADVGTKLAYSLSLEQVDAGFKKYADKTTAMQTIMNNAHKENGEAYDIDEVNEQMEKLNWFTDETSYNFTDMVSNIGKFTSMGKGLEDSVTAMEGISVWASASGQGVNEASRAMYNLSQAMGVGALKLQDWKSIQNANMATEQFKMQAMESAVALGSLEKKLDETTGKYKYFIKGTQEEVSTAAFDQTLSEGWLDSNVLMDTLKEYGKFADELNKLTTATGMEATQIVNDNNGLLKQYAAAADKMQFLSEYIEKNNIEFEDENYTVEQLAEALNTLNSEEYALSKKAFKAAQEAKTLTEAIDATKDAVSTGWMNIFEQIFGNYEEAKAVWSQLAEDLYSIFTPATEGILETLQAWRKLDDIEGAVGTREDLFDSLHSLLTILFDIDSEVTSVAGVIHDAWQDIFPSDAESNALRFANVIIWLKNSVEKFGSFVERHAEDLGNIFKGLFSTFKLIKTLVVQPLKAVLNIFKVFSTGAAGGFVKTLGDIGSRLSDMAEGWTEKINKFFERFNNNVKFVQRAYQQLVTGFTRDGEEPSFLKAIDQFKAGNKIQAIAQAMATVKVAFIKTTDAVKTFFSMLRDMSDMSAWRKDKWTDQASFSKLFNNESLSGAKKAALAVFYAFQKIKKAISAVKDTFVKLLDIFKGAKPDLTDAFEKPKTVAEKLKKVLNGVGSAFAKVADKISSVNTSEGTFSKLIKFFANLGKIVLAVGKVVKGLFNRLLDGFNGLLDNLSVNNLVDLLKSGIIVTLIGKIVKGFKEFFGLVHEGKMSFAGLTGLFDTLDESLESFKKANNAKLLKQVAISVLILVASLVLLSTIDADQIASGILAIGMLMAELAGFLILTSKFMGNAKGFKQASKALTSMSVALLILALAAKVVAGIESNNLDKAIKAITILLAEMTGIMLILSNFGGKAKTSGFAMIAMAAAMLLLVRAVKKIADIDTDQLKKGLIGLGAIFTEVALFMIALKAGGNMISTAFSMILLATAMNIMAGAVKNLGNMGTEELLKGLAGLTVVLAEMVIALLLLSDEKVLAGAAAMDLVSVAILALVPAMAAFGAMSWENLAKGMVTMGVVLAEMVVALLLLDDPKVLAGAAAMLIVAAAIDVLTPAILAFSLLSWGGLAKALLMLAGIMVIFVASMMLLAPLGPIVLAVAGAFALFGVAVLAIGAGVLLLATGLSLLTAVGTGAVAVLTALIGAVIEFIPALIEAVGMGIVALVLAIAESIDSIVQAVGIIIGGVLGVIAELIPSVLEIIGTVISGVLQILVDNTPTFMEWLGQLISGLLDIIEENIPTLFNILYEILDGLLVLITEYIPAFAKAALDVLLAMLQEIESHIEDVTAAALGIIEGFLRGIADGIPGIIDAAFKIVIAFIDGLAEAIENNTEPLFDAIDRLLKAVIKAIVSFFTHAWKDIKQAGKDLMQSGFIQGMKDKIEKIKEVVSDVVDKIKKWFKEKWESMKDIGKNLVDGLSEGLKSKWDDLKNNVTETAGKVTGWFKNVFGINSPSRVFAEIGRYNMMGLAKGFTDNERLTETAAEKVGEDTMDAFGRAMADVYDSIDDNMDMSPTITPVLDFSQIQNGGRYLGSMFGDTRVGVTANAYNASVQARAAAQAQDNANLASALKYYTDRMVSALKSQSGDTNVNVTLEGDAAKLFKAIRTENDKYRASAGRSAFV